MVRTHRLFSFLFGLSMALSIWVSDGLHLPHESHVYGTRLAIAQNNQTVQSELVDTHQLVEEGANYYSAGLFSSAIEPWTMAYEVYKTTQDLRSLAIVSENLARTYQQLGQTHSELRYWESAVDALGAVDVVESGKTALGRLRIEQAQAYSRLGQQQRAIALLCGTPELACVSGSALQLAQAANDEAAVVAAFGSLGEAYRLSGEEAIAKSYLEKGLALSREENSPAQATLLNGLGDVFVDIAQRNYRRAKEASDRGALEASTLADRAAADSAQAVDYFQQSYGLSLANADSIGQMRSLLDLVAAEIQSGSLENAQKHRQLAIKLASRLPDSYLKATAILQLSNYTALSTEAETVELINRALAIGETIDNAQIIAFSLGELGHVDEQAGRYERAIERTQAAQLAAEKADISRDSRYRWDWQIGRIWKAVGEKEAAVQAYAQAVNALEQIRSETASQNQTWQFDFIDTVEPIYRQYAALNVEAAMGNGSAFSSLDKALTTLDSLQVAELQSYFANDCIITPLTTRIDAVQNDATAVISTAILESFASEIESDSEIESASKIEKEGAEGQLVAIASFPDGSKQVARISADTQRVETVINQFRRTLELGIQESISEYDQAPGQQLYDWLIKPFEPALNDIQTMVFVNDGLLRSVPMAALHDGERYLIEKFAVATTPSLTLIEPQRTERPAQLNALLMGVSTQVASSERSFPALSAVDQELATISQILPNSKILLNQALSTETLRQALAETDYRILHLATHGTFGFTPEDNFVVLGAKQENESFNQVLTISELDRIIREVSDPTREPIELLTLTACETAVGAKRATLGLAGVAVRAGVRSAIATLWSVNDASSAELISNFYTQLQDPQLTKAQALQKAQTAMIHSPDDFNDRHPYRWASYILIGNWL